MSAGFLSRPWVSGRFGSTYPTAGAIMIGGAQRTIKYNTLAFQVAFNQRSSASFQMDDPTGTGFVPAWGMPVIVFDGSTRKFAGYITKVRKRREVPSAVLHYEVQCTDNNLIADRRVVWGTGLSVLSLGPGYAGDVVRGLVAQSLTGESVDTSLVVDGPWLAAPMTFYGETLSACLNKVTSAANDATGFGYRWRIDEYQRLVFDNFSGNSAPWNITYPGTVAGRTWRNLEVDEDSDGYRNREYGRTETNLTGTYTEVFDGTTQQATDGTRRDFFVGISPTTGNPIRFMSGLPTITLDTGGGAVALTVGRMIYDGIGDGFDVMYDAGAMVAGDIGGVGVHFLAAATPTQAAPPAGSTLTVTYPYIIGNVVQAENAAEILARQAIEGGSGIHEYVSEQRNIQNGTTLQCIVDGDLLLYGKSPVKITYETDEPTLTPGMIQHVTLAYHGIDDDFFLESIDSAWLERTSFQFRNKITLTNVGPAGSNPFWRQEKLAETARIGSPRQSPPLSATANTNYGRGAGRQSDGTSGNYLESTTLVAGALDANPGPWTLSLWVRNDDLTQANTVVFQYSDLTGFFQFRIDYGSSGFAGQYCIDQAGGSGTSPRTNSGLTPPDTQWHHVCYRKSAAGVSAYDKFIDGVRQSINATVAFTLSASMQRAFAFDDRENQGAFFHGAIAEIACWPVALTNAEVARLANSEPASVVHAAGLVDYWKITGTASPELNTGSSSVSMTIHGTLPIAS